MSCFATAWMISGHPVGIGSYCYSEADVILPVETIKVLTDAEISVVVRNSVAKAEALREEEDRHKEQQRVSPPMPRPERKAIPGQVYLLRDHAGCYKIGISKRAKERALGLSTALPFPLIVMAMGAFADARAKEKELHERFATKRLNGEWFALGAEDVVEIVAELRGTAGDRS